jgi:hypothetical protein
VQTGDDVKASVEAAGYEVLEVEGEKTKSVIDLKGLLQSAYDVGKAAFANGLDGNGANDPKLAELLELNPGGIRDDITIRESWIHGWTQANLAAPVPGVFDEPEPEPIKSTGSMYVEGWGTVGTVKVADLKPGDVQLLDGGKERKVIVVKTDRGAAVPSKVVLFESYIDGEPSVFVTLDDNLEVPLKDFTDETPDNFDTMPDPKPEPVPIDMEALMSAAEDVGRTAYIAGLRKEAWRDVKFTNVVRSGDNTSETFAILSNAWKKGWEKQQAESRRPEPDMVEPKLETGHAFAGAPLSERVDKTSKMNVPGVGKVPAIAVKNIQIGDRLQFIEGVYKVKGVIVKGASSTITFEETDDAGNNLKLKKQNRTFLGVERTQLHPGGYVPKPDTGKPKVTPHWARKKEDKDSYKDKLVATGGDFVASNTVVEATNRLKHQFLKLDKDIIHFYPTDIDLKGLELSQLNSIIHGLERTVGKYNIKLDHIGWNDKKQSASALYSYLGHHKAILFQKTATKNVKAHHKKTLKNFELGKDRNIETQERYLRREEVQPGAHGRTREKITKLNALKRWTVDSELDDMLLGTVVHEGHHAIYYSEKLKDKWHDNVERLVGRKLTNELKCASVSEYGMSNMSEFFAEVGVAVEFGVDIDPDVKQAYLETMAGVK